MEKRRIPAKSALLLVAALLVIPSLLFTGCPPHIDSQYGVKVTGDGAGGAIALYEDELGGNIYAQKISPDGNPAWGEKGVLLGGSGSQSYSFSNLNIISDGASGAIVSWVDSSQSQIRPINHIVRLDAAGNLVWQRDFIYFNEMIGDGQGGAIIAFDSVTPVTVNGVEQKNLILFRIDAQGDYPWGEQGVTVPRGNYQDNTLQMARDGAGGVVIVWEELKYPADARPGETISTGRIFVQKINGKGEMVWGNNLLVHTTAADTYAEWPQIASDGSGGAVVAWHRGFNGPVTSGSPQAQIVDIMVQKLDAGGSAVWQANGLPLEINKNSGAVLPLEPSVVSDGAGGAIAVWRDRRQETALYAQRVDAGGALAWQAGGIKVAATSLNPHHQVIAGAPGEALVSYSFLRDWETLRVQKLDSRGQTLWQVNGVPVVEKSFDGYSISSDGQGGMIVAWGVNGGRVGSERAYVQRIGTDGRVLWGEGGVKLN